MLGRCWCADPCDRLTSSELVEELERMMMTASADLSDGEAAVVAPPWRKAGREGPMTMPDGDGMTEVECSVIVTRVQTLVGLLASEQGDEVGYAAAELCNVAAGSEARTQAVVDGGAIVPLVGLLSSARGEEADSAARALRNIAAGSEARRQAVVVAGGAAAF